MGFCMASLNPEWLTEWVHGASRSSAKCWRGRFSFLPDPGTPSFSYLSHFCPHLLSWSDNLDLG